MSSSPNGSDTSTVEVTHVSANGVWLLAHDTEMFMSYEDFPWFADQPIKAILRVEEPTPGHYYWPDLDVDLSDEIIENPERFPLRAGSAS